MIHVPYTYKDSLGEWLNGTLEVPLKLAVSTSTTTQPTEAGPASITDLLMAYWWLLLIAVAAVLVAYVLVKRRKSRL
jgi:hypothetical protein